MINDTTLFALSLEVLYFIDVLGVFMGVIHYSQVVDAKRVVVVGATRLLRVTKRCLRVLSIIYHKSISTF